MRKAKLSNQMGTLCLKAENFAKAQSLFGQAVTSFEQFKAQQGEEKRDLGFSNVWFNQGNLFAAQKKYEQAIRAYVVCISESPFQILNHLDQLKSNVSAQDLIDLHSKQDAQSFNSFEAYARCFTNLSVMLMLMNEYQLAHLCCIKSIELLPQNKEAYINMNNIMRQIGKKQEAFAFVWSKVARSIDEARKRQPGIEGITTDKEEFDKPFALPKVVSYTGQDKQQQRTFRYDKESVSLQVVCVKYGTKYGADYVNKLYYGVKTHLSLPHTFHCFTEDGEGLDTNIKVVPLANHWQAWWSKVHIFDGQVYSSAEKPKVLVMYIDLDMIISGSLDSLVHSFDGRFATLTTNDIFCEQTQDGYNSSIMLFTAERDKERTLTQVQVLFDTLSKYYDHILKFLMRFDHYLEMLVENADILQDMCPD